MNEVTYNEYYNIMREVQNGFPSIKNIPIKIINKEFTGLARLLWNPINGYRIIINPNRIKNMNKFAFKGLISHELSHVEQHLESNKILRLYNSFINYLRINYFPKIRKKEVINKLEKNADYRAIKQGYGQELISLVNFEKSKGIRLQNDYLSVPEIKKLINQ